MDIVLAKSAGFCFGVKRAVNSVYDEIENCRSIWLSTGKAVILYLLREQEAISIIILWQKERNKTAMARKPYI